MSSNYSLALQTILQMAVSVQCNVIGAVTVMVPFSQWKLAAKGSLMICISRGSGSKLTLA